MKRTLTLRMVVAISTAVAALSACATSQAWHGGNTVAQEGVCAIKATGDERDACLRALPYDTKGTHRVGLSRVDIGDDENAGELHDLDGLLFLRTHASGLVLGGLTDGLRVVSYGRKNSWSWVESESGLCGWVLNQYIDPIRGGYDGRPSSHRGCRRPADRRSSWNIRYRTATESKAVKKRWCGVGGAGRAYKRRNPSQGQYTSAFCRAVAGDRADGPGKPTADTWSRLRTTLRDSLPADERIPGYTTLYTLDPATGADCRLWVSDPRVDRQQHPIQLRALRPGARVGLRYYSYDHRKGLRSAGNDPSIVIFRSKRWMFLKAECVRDKDTRDLPIVGLAPNRAWDPNRGKKVRTRNLF